jgi:hypothetical protein
MVGESIVKTSKTRRKKEPEEGFDMAILPARETGLPFVVFILQDMGIIPNGKSTPPSIPGGQPQLFGSNGTRKPRDTLCFHSSPLTRLQFLGGLGTQPRASEIPLTTSGWRRPPGAFPGPTVTASRCETSFFARKRRQWRWRE